MYATFRRSYFDVKMKFPTAYEEWRIALRYRELRYRELRPDDWDTTAAYASLLSEQLRACRDEFYDLLRVTPVLSIHIATVFHTRSRYVVSVSALIVSSQASGTHPVASVGALTKPTESPSTTQLVDACAQLKEKVSRSK